MLILSLALTLSACHDPEGDAGLGDAVLTEDGHYALQVEHQPDPPATGDATLLVQILDAADGALLTGSTLTVTPWMPDHGHGVMEDPVVVEDEGLYTVEFAYSMPGTWELTFEVDGALGLDQRVLTVEVQ